MTLNIHLDDLVTGLDEWKGRYFALDVFADDVAELQEPEPLKNLTPLGGEPPRFEFQREGITYHLVLFHEQGVLRIERAKPDAATRMARVAPTGQAGAVIGAAVQAATKKKGAAAQLGLLLGLVVGATVDGDRSAEPQRLFALRFDTRSRTWRMYNGGLLEWVRRELLPA